MTCKRLCLGLPSSCCPWWLESVPRGQRDTAFYIVNFISKWAWCIVWTFVFWDYFASGPTLSHCVLLFFDLNPPAAGAPVGCANNSRKTAWDKGLGSLHLIADECLLLAAISTDRRNTF